MSRIEIITIGDELLEGRLVDTNAAELSQRLTDEGFRVTRHLSVGDDREEIATVLAAAAGRADAVLVSGGLGPTTDDLTAESAAAAFARPVARYPQALEHVRTFFAQRGRVMSRNNEKQADLPEGSTILPNPTGTAVGFRFCTDRCRCYFLPGVPRELRHIFEESVLPDLRTFLAAAPPHLATLRIFGKGESDVGQLLQGIGGDLPEGTRLTIQYRAAFPEIHVRLVLAGLSGDEADRCLDRLAADALRRLAPHVYASGRGRVRTTFAEVVAADLRRHGATVAVAEGCTWGEVSRQLARADAGDVFRGGLVVPSLPGGRMLPTLPPVATEGEGAYSLPVAVALAEQVRETFTASHGLAVVGSSEDREAAAESPAGTIQVAVCGPRGCQDRSLFFPLEPERFRCIAAHAALAVLRRSLDTTV